MAEIKYTRLQYLKAKVNNFKQFLVFSGFKTLSKFYKQKQAYGRKHVYAAGKIFFYYNEN